MVLADNKTCSVASKLVDLKATTVAVPFALMLLSQNDS